MNVQKTITSRAPILGSSVDPDKVSLMVKGVLVGLVPVITLVLKSFGFTALEADIVQIIDAIVGIISLVLIAWGGTRKIIVSRQ